MTEKFRQFIIETTVPYPTDSARLLAQAGQPVTRGDLGTALAAFNIGQTVAIIQTVNDTCLILTTDGQMTYADANFTRLYSHIRLSDVRIAESGFGPLFKAKAVFPAYNVGEQFGDWTHVAVTLENRISDFAGSEIRREQGYEIPESTGDITPDTGLFRVGDIEKIDDGAEEAGKDPNYFASFGVRMIPASVLVNMSNIVSCSSHVRGEGTERITLTRLKTVSGQAIDTIGVLTSLLNAMSGSCMIYTDPGDDNGQPSPEVGR